MYIARIRTQILEHKLGQQLQRFGKDTDLRFHGVPRHSCDKICILDLHFFYPRSPISILNLHWHFGYPGRILYLHLVYALPFCILNLH